MIKGHIILDHRHHLCSGRRGILLRCMSRKSAPGNDEAD